MADLHVTHRLDRLTSGVVIFAKSSSMADDIRKAIEQRSPQKIYLGDCDGCDDDAAAAAAAASGPMTCV